jgi:hypothetical protein
MLILSEWSIVKFFLKSGMVMREAPGSMTTRVISGCLAWYLVMALPLSGWGSYLQPGTRAPGFRVTSADDELLTLEMIRGKVIVLFYESRDVIRKNIDLNNALKDLHAAQPPEIRNQIFRLVVVDASDAFWVTRGIWNRRLRELSRKEGFTIYGDWDRQMFLDYRMRGGDSNFLIIDKQGVIRYSASGKISMDQFDRIKNLLLELIDQGRSRAATRLR